MFLAQDQSQGLRRPSRLRAGLGDPRGRMPSTDRRWSAIEEGTESALPCVVVDIGVRAMIIRRQP